MKIELFSRPRLIAPGTSGRGRDTLPGCLGYQPLLLLIIRYEDPRGSSGTLRHGHLPVCSFSSIVFPHHTTAVSTVELSQQQQCSSDLSGSAATTLTTGRMARGPPSSACPTALLDTLITVASPKFRAVWKGSVPIAEKNATTAACRIIPDRFLAVWQS